MSAIDLRDVTKTYPGVVTAVDSFTLEIADGELVVVLGPAGCGKTTLLRLIAGLERADSGDIAINGLLANRLEPARRDVAMVFQSGALYPHMSVEANLTYGARARRVAKAEIIARLGHTASALDLDHLLESRPESLSLAERQRVAIGRAVLRAPGAFLFDEPVGGLDAGARAALRGRIRDIQRALATVMLYATQDQADAMALADRLVVMKDGRIEQVGAPLQVYRRPLTLFAAGFIGSPAMNLFPIEVGAMTGAIHIERGVSLTGAFGPLAAEARGGLVLGIRPEHVLIASADQQADFRAEVIDVENFGADTIVQLRAGAKVPVAMRLAGTPALAEGDIVPLMLDRSAFHFFDARTGVRLDPAPAA